MKTLIIVRHAKSSWDNTHQDDFDRPLNARGMKDAPEMARRLRSKTIPIDAFVSSTAVRAWQTAVYFAEAYDVAESSIIRIPALYHADVPAFYETVSTLSNELRSVALFSHNPGITEFVNSLGVNTRVDNMPTCAVFGVRTRITSWKDFENGEKEYWFFDYPKQGIQ